MALRDLVSGGEMAATGGSSAVSVLPPYWDSADAAPKTDWEEWWDLFMVATNAKYSISVNELLRPITQNQPRVPALINNLNEQAAERKLVSVLFLSLGSAARKSLTDKFPEMRIATITLKDIKENCEQAFVKPRNRTLERYKIFSQKQQPKETLRQFWHTLTGLAARCAFGEQTESLIMDTFIQNINNKMVQQKLCTEPKDDPQEAFRFAVAYEEGITQHKTFETGTTIKNEPVYAVTERKNPCPRCGLEFSQNHLVTCKAKNEKGRNSAGIGHFARMCKRPKNGNTRERGNFTGRTGMRRINLIEREDNQSEESSEQEDNMVLHIGGKEDQPFVLKGKINNQNFTTMIDSGSPITIFTPADLRELLKVDVIFARPMPKTEQYVDYNNKPLNLLGFTSVDVKVGKRTIKNARIFITRDGKRSLIGRDWLNQLNFRVREAGENSEYTNIIKSISERKTLVNLKEKFPQLFTRQGRIKGFKIKCEFKKDAKITQQKGRRLPLQLQAAVEKEIDKLLEEGHIKRVDKISDEVFIQPVVVTVKKDKTAKIALDARSLNNAILKEKYQMPNLDNLMEQIAEIINNDAEGEVLFTSLDMLYAYGQTELHPTTARHCNFQIIGGRATGTYVFNTGCYGLTIMPPEFQKIMDTVLINIRNTFTFIDDILIVTKGTHQQHIEKVEEVLRTLDEAVIRLKLEKCKIAQTETEWLGYKLTANGVKPIDEKIQAMSDRLRPKTLKELRSLMGALNQMNRFIPNLAQLCAPLRPLLSKTTEWEWKDEQEKAFQEIKKALQKITEIKHFKRDPPVRIICDASKEGLGAVLQQQTDEGWRATLFASRFLTSFEQKYSKNELELLAVVWAIENFRNYVYGIQFEVVSDHRAPTSILKGNRANKTYSSRLTRWVDRLLPFQFTIKHEPGRSLGMADYLSRHPSPSKKDEQSKAEELWNNWFTVNKLDYAKFVLDTKNRKDSTEQPMRKTVTSKNERPERKNQPIRRSDAKENKMTEENMMTKQHEKECAPETSLTSTGTTSWSLTCHPGKALTPPKKTNKTRTLN